VTTKTVERRQTPGTVELRAAASGGQHLGGYALKYGTYSQNLGGYVESIQAGTFTKSLADGGDVLCRYQHDSDMLLGRTLADTLALEDLADGLDYDVEAPDTSYARDLVALVKRGDVRHSSFAFRCVPGGEQWGFTEMGFPLRTLVEAQLVDVAPVVTPAYLDSSTGLRGLAEQRGLDLDLVVKAAAVNELGDLLRAKDPTVIDLKTPDSGPPRDTHGPLAVRQLRAELLKRGNTL
jgi:HK97 family phage prohead protease